MPIDTTPSTVATNALQAIPFSSLIGAPLDACIQAQANAAKTSWEFINQVGLTIDPETGEKKAINVTFQYNNNGQMTTLIVPLLTIVPIPYLAIDKVSIDFMANISAASSSVEETSTDTELGIDATAEAAFKVGPFSLKIKANANYSSKQSSKSAQDSRYSVEYTMNVKVEGGQADMPAGLGTILNILQGSSSSVSPDDTMAISPANLTFDQQDTSTLQVTVKDTHGILAVGTKVSLIVEGENPFSEIEVVRGTTEEQVTQTLTAGRPLDRASRTYLKRYPQDQRRINLAAKHRGRMISAPASTNALMASASGQVVGVTNQQGTVIFRFYLKEDVFKGDRSVQGRLMITAEVPIAGNNSDLTQKMPETQQIEYLIIPRGPDYINLSTATTGTIQFAGGNASELVSILASFEDEPVEAEVKATVSILTAGVSATEVFTKIKVDEQASDSEVQASGTTDSEGTIDFGFTTIATPKACKGRIVFTSPSSGGNNIVLPFEVTEATTPAAPKATPVSPPKTEESA